MLSGCVTVVLLVINYHPVNTRNFVGKSEKQGIQKSPIPAISLNLDSNFGLFGAFFEDFLKATSFNESHCQRV